jgi:hypothetical protein
MMRKSKELLAGDMYVCSLGLVEPQLANKIQNGFRLVSVMFELAEPDGSNTLKIHYTYPNALLFLGWLEENGLCGW